MTASDAMQVAFEGGEIKGEPTLSVFTQVLVEGIQTGAADRNKDGEISMDELYDYVYEHIRRAYPDQTPTISNLEMRGDIVIALNPHREVEQQLPVGGDGGKPEEEGPKGEEPEEGPKGEEPEEGPKGQEPEEPVVPPPVPIWRKRRFQIGVGACALLAGVAAFAALAAFRDSSGSSEWSLVDDEARVLDGPPPEELWDVTAVDGEDVVAVGRSGTGQKQVGVWTYDGSTWSRLDPSKLGAETGQLYTAASSGEAVLAAGWVDQGGEGRNAAIWMRSADGDWGANRCPPDECGGSGKQEILGVAAVSGGGWVAVGREDVSGDFDAAVWISADGSAWERVRDESFAGPKDQAMNDVVELDGRLIAVGRNGHDGAVWTSDDGGESWELPPTKDSLRAPSGGNVNLGGVAAHGSRLVAVGREASGESPNRAAAWLSDDRGTSWERANVTNARYIGQQMIAVTDAQSGLVAVGFDHSDQNGLQEAAVWESADGREWKSVATVSVADGSKPIMRGVAVLPGDLVAVGDSEDDSGSTRGRIWSAPSG